MKIFRFLPDSAVSAVARAAAHPSSWLGIPVRVRNRLFPAVAYPAYVALWRANTGSMSAFSMQSVAQGWLIISLTQSPMMLGILGLFQSVPMILLSPIGGIFADRLDRGRVIQGAQLMVLVGSVTIGALVALDWIQIWHLIIFSMVTGASFAVSVPSRHAIVADLVPRKIVPNAVALNNATLSIANFIGPSLAGFLVGALGIASAYFTQSGAYLWSIVNVNMIDRVAPPPRGSASLFQAVRAGFAYVLRHTSIRTLMLLGLAPSLLGWPVLTLIPAFVKLDLEGGPEDLGILLGVLGAGSLVGAVTSIFASGIRSKGRMVIVALLVQGAMILILAMTRSFIQAALVLWFIGFGQAVYFAFNHSIIQLVVRGDVRGRVMSVWMLGWGLTPVGLLPISAVAERLGTPVAFGLAGSLCILFVLSVAALSRDLWKLQTDPDDDSPTGQPA
ncbi:MAG: MFS transporter [Chloroflexi bacterium]|nr:MFS transporter [Chloroflexota bacterium]